MTELRKDPVNREWVIIASERAKRPTDFVGQEAAAPVPAHVANCPFCAGNEAMTPPALFTLAGKNPEQDKESWRIRVVPNRFPALVPGNGDLERLDVGPYDRMAGIGAHEVVIETPDHSKTVGLMGEEEVYDLLEIYKQRYNFLRQDPNLKFILIFRNHGRIAGASLAHPHSQIIATPTIPQMVWDDMRGISQYFGYRQRCVFCHKLEYEQEVKERLVIKGTHFVALTPYASRYPFEIWILPYRHYPSFTQMDEAEQRDLAKVLRETLARLYHCLGDPPYNYSFHICPCDDHSKYDFHWHIEISPRLSTAAGFELGTGIYINPTPPEHAAKYLREVELPADF
jgi:UDPglucose--hexose-1-phosphate uridylyltransferase